MGEIVRTPVGPNVRLPTRRTREEQFFVRWPRAYVATARMVQALPPRSRLRRAMLRRNALSGWGAWVRGDLELCVVRFAPDYDYEPPREWLLPGMPTSYRGHAGLLQWAADLREAWEILDHTPLEIVDAGEIVAFACKIRLRATRSGVELDSRLGQVFWIERGLIVRERDFGGWTEALQLLGVAEEANGRTPSRAPVT
jgi:ketosteroid isomerase-like protein